MKQESNSKSDTIVFVVCVLLVVGFVVALPYLNSMVRKAKEIDEKKEDVKIPTTYECVRLEEEDDYTLKQEATYTIQNQKVTSAKIHRLYTFQTEEAFTEFLKDNKELNSVGETDKIESNATKKTVERTTTMNLLKMNPDEEELINFPKTYSNLLIYTKDQKCTPTY